MKSERRGQEGEKLVAEVLQEEKGGVKKRRKWRGEKGVEVCEKLLREE